MSQQKKNNIVVRPKTFFALSYILSVLKTLPYNFYNKHEYDTLKAFRKTVIYFF